MNGLQLFVRNGVAPAIMVHGTPVPADSFVLVRGSQTWSVRGRYGLTQHGDGELNGVPLSTRSVELLALPVSCLMAKETGR